MKTKALFAASFSFFVSLSFAGATDWHKKVSPHFEIYHESNWSPDSIAIELERIYNMMKLDLSMFSPWMIRKKTKIYIYAGKETYTKGEFKPPPWSKGLAFFKTRTVVVYDSGDVEKLRAVVSHELAHVYFESFFAEKLKIPPPWLNEGLAVMIEDRSYGESGPWDRALRYIDFSRFFSFKSFFEMEAGKPPNKQQVGDWYLKSFGLVKYLYPPDKRIQFKHFCDLIREGENIEKALWKAYRLRSLSVFGDKWMKWLRFYRKGNAEGTGDGRFKFKPFKTGNGFGGFKNFGEK